MRIWIDAQMSPAIAAWISSNYAVSAVAIRDLGLRDADDKEIFHAARQEKAVVMTKDSDFVLLLDKLKRSPNEHTAQGAGLLNLGEKLVEISAA
jgi:predicted nuclease of predicted toxin-antitoxin system